MNPYAPSSDTTGSNARLTSLKITNYNWFSPAWYECLIWFRASKHKISVFPIREGIQQHSRIANQCKLQVLVNILGSKVSPVVQSSGPVQWIDTPASNCSPTIIQYYREVGTPLIQHICTILAFGSGSYGTTNTPWVHFKFEYSCKCKSQAVFW